MELDRRFLAVIAALATFVTTTTGNADSCLQRFEYCRQILRPDLRVHVVPVTEQWADIVVCGPQTREALAKAGIAPPAA